MSNHVKRKLNNSKFSEKNTQSLAEVARKSDINTGMFGQASFQPVKKRIKSENETVIAGTTNSFIILGNDRPNSIASGYGSKNASDCAMIDLCVGTGLSKENDNNDETYFINSNFKTDAARIYISQLTDIDKNFYIKTKDNTENKSGIGLKADHVRIIAREKIKLITGTDTQNSLKGDIKFQYGGIELIAGNSEKNLQPLVLGENLKEYLVHLNKKIDTFYNVFFKFYQTQSEFNETVASHTHTSPFFAHPTLLSPNLFISEGMRSIENLIDVDMGTFFWKYGMNSMEEKFLVSEGSSKYILSSWNKTN